MRARDYITCQPLGSDPIWGQTLPYIPQTMEPLALLCLDSYNRPDAIMVRVKSSGALAAWRAGGSLATLDQRKAAIALAAMETAGTDADKTDLARTLKGWRDAADMTQSRAAEVLGISQRTYEAIEQGRGFRYPQMLRLALLAFGG